MIKCYEKKKTAKKGSMKKKDMWCWEGKGRGKEEENVFGEIIQKIVSFSFLV
jgi:hypothetical protein